MNRTAGQMLFDGWSLENYHPIIELINQYAGLDLPLIDKFGYFYGVGFHKDLFQRLLCSWV